MDCKNLDKAEDCNRTAMSKTFTRAVEMELMTGSAFSYHSGPDTRPANQLEICSEKYEDHADSGNTSLLYRRHDSSTGILNHHQVLGMVLEGRRPATSRTPTMSSDCEAPHLC